jgi:hypothetical protein
MIPAAFERQKWPRRHEHLVEECVAAGRVLHVSDVLPYLTGWHRNVIRSWNPPTHPWLTLLPRMGGPFRLWWFLCPICRRRCEALYVPGARPDDHRCRTCWGLIYASQRYGFRHPLRRVSTPRKKITRRKELSRQQRQSAPRRSVAGPASVAESVDESWIREGAERMTEHIARHEAEANAVRARIAAEAERSRAVIRNLAATAKSRGVRQRASRALARHGPRLDPRSQSMRTRANVSRPALTLSAAEVERVRRVLAEVDRQAQARNVG